MIRDYPSIESPNGVYEWVAPIELGDLISGPAPGWHEQGTLFRNGSMLDDADGTLFNGSTWRWSPELGRWGVHGDADLSQHVQWRPGTQPTTYSFFCWFKMPTPQSTSENGNDSIFRTTLGNFRGFGISSRSLTADRFVVHVRDNTGTVHGHSPTLPNTGDWIHAGGVVVANDYFTRYVNGVPTHTYSIGTPEWHSQVCYLCRGGTGYVTVTVADMLLTRTALSPPQVRWFSKRENNPWTPWRRRHWSFAVAGNWSWLHHHLSNSPYGIAK